MLTHKGSLLLPTAHLFCIGLLRWYCLPCLQLEVAEREKQHMQQRLQQHQPQNGISQIKMQELSKQVGRPLHFNLCLASWGGSSDCL
jgi:hypothetical protein